MAGNGFQEQLHKMESVIDNGPPPTDVPAECRGFGIRERVLNQDKVQPQPPKKISLRYLISSPYSDWQTHVDNQHPARYWMLSQDPLAPGGLCADIYVAYDRKTKQKRFIKEQRLIYSDYEAAVQAYAAHPDIPAVYDIIPESDERSFIVMEYVEGETVKERMLRQPFGLDEAESIFRKLCSVVAYTNGKGILHQDLRPGNIILERKTQSPKLVDFGVCNVVETVALAKHAGRPPVIAESLQDNDRDIYQLALTLGQMIIGKDMKKLTHYPPKEEYCLEAMMLLRQGIEDRPFLADQKLKLVSFFEEHLKFERQSQYLDPNQLAREFAACIG